MAKDDNGLWIGRHTRLRERELVARKLESVGASAVVALVFNCFLRRKRVLFSTVSYVCVQSLPWHIIDCYK